MGTIKLTEKELFLFIVGLKPQENDLFFAKDFFDAFDILDSSNYEKLMVKLKSNNVIAFNDIINEYVFTFFGSLLGNLRFKEIRLRGVETEIKYLNHLVKIGAFSHLERN